MRIIEEIRSSNKLVYLCWILNIRFLKCFMSEGLEGNEDQTPLISSPHFFKGPCVYTVNKWQVVFLNAHVLTCGLKTFLMIYLS